MGNIAGINDFIGLKKILTFIVVFIFRTAKEIRFYINANKTEFISLNQDTLQGMKSLNENFMKQVEDCKYLDSFISSTEHDIDIRLAKVWGALNQTLTTKL